MNQSKLLVKDGGFSFTAKRKHEDSDEEEGGDFSRLTNRKKVEYSKVAIIDVFSNKKKLVDDIFTDDLIASALPTTVSVKVYQPVIKAYNSLREEPSITRFADFQDAYSTALYTIMAQCFLQDFDGKELPRRTIFMPYGSFFCSLVVMYDAYMRRKVSYEDYKVTRDHVMSMKRQSGRLPLGNINNPHLNTYYLDLHADLIDPQKDNDDMDLTALEYIREIPKLISIFTNRRTAQQAVSLTKQYDLRKMLECSEGLLTSIKEEDLLNLNDNATMFIGF